MKRNWISYIGIVVLLLTLIVGCTNQNKQSQSQSTQQPANQTQQEIQMDQQNNNSDQDGQKMDKKEEKMIIENPQPDSTKKIGMSFELVGKTKLDTKELYYEFEDGHNILSKGKIPLTSSKDAAGWIEFKYNIKLEQSPSSPFGTLILYALQKDGTKAEQLMVTYNFDPKIVKP
ncbi:hypothetical protein [Tepidibacillus marianensis]|uniref:hypothetical protein n=1 Tax=Tepidibacillus marianensis TaxID=3131995 RepID=UPI0030CBE598